MKNIINRDLSPSSLYELYKSINNIKHGYYSKAVKLRNDLNTKIKHYQIIERDLNNISDIRQDIYNVLCYKLNNNKPIQEHLIKSMVEDYESVLKQRTKNAFETADIIINYQATLFPELPKLKIIEKVISVVDSIIKNVPSLGIQDLEFYQEVHFILQNKHSSQNNMDKQEEIIKRYEQKTISQDIL